MYADDVVLFLSPKEQDLILARGILEIFARTSGLATNINKCLISPIHVISRPWCLLSFFPGKWQGRPIPNYLPWHPAEELMTTYLEVEMDSGQIFLHLVGLSCILCGTAGCSWR